MTPLVSVLGNLSVDLVDDQPPSPGGCPSFAGVALRPLGTRALLVTRAAEDDLSLFTGMLGALEVPHRVLPSTTTSSFGLRYSNGDDRTLLVEAIGPSWTADDVAALDLGPWVHVSPLLRSDFPVEAIEALAAKGCSVAYDGQGLVRVAEVGPLTVDAGFDRGLLRHIRVLKLADDEAHVVAGGPFDERTAADLGVPEILVTHGSAGCDLYVDGRRTHLPAARPVTGTHSTGAGDMFTVAYVIGRAGGLPPVPAAGEAAGFVARQLEQRRDQGEPGSRP